MRPYSESRIVFCGNRQIACDSLDMMRDEFGIRPVGLIVSKSAGASHQDEIRAKCDHLTSDEVLCSPLIRTDGFMFDVAALSPDLIVSVHFPHILPAAVLDVPVNGAVNLHPSYLPFNRGWHTPSWAILDGTPAGATLHYMEEGLDSGNILAQAAVPVLQTDTAHSLYQRVLSVEIDILREGLPRALGGDPGTPQTGEGTAHDKADLLNEGIRNLDHRNAANPARFVDVMRALTTNSLHEAAYFEQNGRRYAVQIEIYELE